MSIESQIKSRLEEELSPTYLEVENQSHLHAGHAGDDGTGESHFHIAISSPAFDDMSRLDRQRMIHAALGDIMKQIHALSVEIIQK
ncbi:MAG: BolA family protein [Pseudomonadota bacterium]